MPAAPAASTVARSWPSRRNPRTPQRLEHREHRYPHGQWQYGFSAGWSLGVDVVGSDTVTYNTVVVPAAAGLTKLGSGGLVLGLASHL